MRSLRTDVRAQLHPPVSHPRDSPGRGKTALLQMRPLRPRIHLPQAVGGAQGVGARLRVPVLQDEVRVAQGQTEARSRNAQLDQGGGDDDP